MISGIGIAMPGAIGAEALLAHLRSAALCTRDTGAIDEAAILHLLNARRVRRMSDYVKLTLAATALALADAGLTVSPLTESASAILGSTHGSSNYSSVYYKQLVEQGIIGANPMLFAEGVPNAGAAHLSLMLSIKGACQTVIGSRTAGLDALRLASVRIASGQWDRAIVSAGEEYCEMVNAAYGHCGLYAGRGGGGALDGSGFVVGAGAVTLVLESAEALRQRGGRSHGRILACTSARSLDRSSVEPARQVLEELAERNYVISSANNTHIDRIEAAAIRKSAPQAVTSMLYGRFPETFSAGPLAAVATLLLSRRMPRAVTGQPGLRLASGSEQPAQCAVLCSDYHGLAAGVRIALSDSREGA